MDSGESLSYGRSSTETEKKMGVEDVETGGWDLRATLKRWGGGWQESETKLEKGQDRQRGRDTEEGEKQSDIFLRGPGRLRVASAL